MSKTYNIVIIEPSPIIQSGLRNAIEQMPNFKIVGSIADVNRIEERISSMHADIVILNPSLIEFHKRNNIRNLLPQPILIALLYSYIDNDILRQFHGVIDIYDDASKISTHLNMAVATADTEEVGTEGSDLSEREKEIVVLVAKGLMNKEIASKLNLSIHTVISHRKNVSRKTGIKSVSGFVVYALLNNLIEQNELQ